MPLRAGIGMPPYGKFGSTESQFYMIRGQLNGD
jgi:hypothetical protein